MPIRLRSTFKPVTVLEICEQEPYFTGLLVKIHVDGDPAENISAIPVSSLMDNSNGYQLRRRLRELAYEHSDCLLCFAPMWVKKGGDWELCDKCLR